MRFLITMSLIGCVVANSVAQAPTTQDCLGAIPVCIGVYKESTAPSGFGTFANEVNNQLTCLFDDDNAIWYTFTVNSSGDFGFLLTPNDPDDDYDWGLWNLTNNTCADIANDASFMVSCNAAGNTACHGPTGATGDTNYTIQGGGCEANPPDQLNGQTPFNAFIPVQEGNTYVLMVSNWTGSQNGYEIDFGLSQDIGIFDQIKPAIRNWSSDATPGCSPSQIQVEFTEAIQCATIAASNFQIQDASGNLYTIALSSQNCDIGGAFSRNFTLDIIDPLIDTGTYVLQLESQENNKVLDLCDNPTSSFDDLIVITIEGISNIDWPTDTLVCDEPSLFLDATDPKAESYLWNDGSTDPTYSAIASGTYSVTVTNQCEIRESTIDVTLLNDREVTLDLGPNPNLCAGDSHVLASGLSSDLIHQWVDGTTGTSRTVTESDTYGLTVSDVCGELATDVITITFEESPLTFTLDEQVFLCDGEVLQLDVTDPNGENYNWNTGASTPQITVIAGGTYTVEVSNTCETRIQSVVVIEDSCIDCDIYIPNSFRPQGAQNGQNSSLSITSNCTLGNYNMKVFDRWGNIQFQSTDPNVSWDGYGLRGKHVLPGIYVYALSYSYVEFGQVIEEEKQGDIFLVR